MSWSQAEISRMESELGGETTASNAEFSFYGNDLSSESKDKALADYLYHELEDEERIVFEHTFGYGGKSILKNKEIAKKLRTNEMSIHRMKSKLADKIRSYR
jgi:DNA-directed RNA polymerase specialized sigma subunit